MKIPKTLRSDSPKSDKSKLAKIPIFQAAV